MSASPHRAALARRRAARRAAEEAAATRAATFRLRLLGAAVLLAAAVVAVAAALSAGGGGGGAAGGGGALAGVREARALYAGLPERDGVLGDPAAPLTVTEYADLQCPACAASSAATLPALIRDHVRTGEAKLQVRVLRFLGPDSERAARAAAGAERQGRLFPFLSVFYANQGAENSGYVTGAFLRDVLTAAGADPAQSLRHAGSDAATARLREADAAATAVGVTGTPTFTVSRDGGPERVLDPADPAGALAAERAR